MVDCSQFIEEYSDFRDGLLEEARWEALEAHRASCASCARYDRVVGGGVEVLSGLPRLDPSPDFAARLQHRIFHLEMEDRRSPRHASAASVGVTVTIAAALGLTAWLPAMRPQDAPVRLPPVVAHAPYHHEVVPVLYRAGPLLQAASGWSHRSAALDCAAGACGTASGSFTSAAPVPGRLDPTLLQNPFLSPVAVQPRPLLYLTGQ